MIVMNLGQVFTNSNVVDFMINRYCSFVDKKDINILEPSSWENAFVKSLIDKWYKNISYVEYDPTLYKSNLITDIQSYNGDFFTYEWTGYDLIIWNPPYVQNNEIIPETKLLLKNEIDNNEWDLYYYFIQKSVQKLNDWGFLVFILPITFLTNTYAKSLRDFLYENWQFKEIFSFEEERIFTKCPEVIVFIYEKTKNAKWNLDIGIFNTTIKYSKNKTITKDNFIIKTIPHFSKEQFFWNIYENTENNKDFTSDINDFFNVSVWMVSWFDQAFKVNESIEYTEIEKAYIISIMKANWKISKFIFFDKWTITCEEDLKKLPNIYNQLSSFKVELLNRYTSKNTKYWEWATVRNKDLFDINKSNLKFFIPTITRSPLQKFIATNEFVYGGWDVIALIPKNKSNDIYITDDFVKYINDTVPKKWWRKMFTQKFLSSVKLNTKKN